MRFRAEQHLRRAAEIRAVRERGQRMECRTFTLWWKLRTPSAADESAAVKATTPGARVCVIASTAAVGNATRRARAKRRLREVFRLNQTVVPTDCDLLMIARRSALDTALPEMATRFQEACSRIASAPRT